jgi:prolyl-tRNA synthetase
MGALIMAHSDDYGLVLPPKLAPIQVVIVPIYRKDEELAQIVELADKIADGLKKLGVSVKVDGDDQHKPGWKFAQYELQGVPVRLAIGPRDLQNGTVELARRDTLTKEVLPLEGIEQHIHDLMDEIQTSIYQRAMDYRIENTRTADTYDEFKQILKEKGGFIMAHWDGTAETEEKIKQETKATIRCLPIDGPKEPGKCMVTGKPSERRVAFAIAY